MRAVHLGTTASAKVWWCWGIFVINIFQGVIRPSNALQDDMFYFTSFKDVKGWEEVYDQCNISYQFPRQNLNMSSFPYTLSPIALPDSKNALPVLPVTNSNLQDDETVLLIYTNPPPPIGSFAVSYGFPANKECLVNTIYSPCHVSPTLGRIRGVVLTAERIPLKKIKDDFTVEDPERFATILNGGSKNERKFYEALFMGSSRGSNGERSTHTVNGKSYPMEIYLFFIDETLPAMSSTTILVVLVEEQEGMNVRVNPVVNAITNHLYQMERIFLKSNEQINGRERSFHHLGPSIIEDPFNLEPDKSLHPDRLMFIPSSIDVEKENADIEDYMEKVQTFHSNTLFNEDDFEQGAAGIDARELNYEAAYELDTGNGIKTPIRTLVPEYYYILKYWDMHCGEYFSEPDDWETNQDLQKKVDLQSRPDYKVAYEYIVELNKSLSDWIDHKSHSISGNSEMETTLKIRAAANSISETEAKLYAAILKVDSVKNTIRPQYLKLDFVRSILPFKTRWVAGFDLNGYREELDKLVEGVVLSGNKVGFPDTTSWKIFDNIKDDIIGFSTEEIVEPFHKLRSHKYGHIGSLRFGNLGIKVEDYTAYENMHPIKFFLKNTFQISWLLPDGGGYYIYSGSSPVPPCYQAERTIVFKKPIKMSKEQIKALTVIPTSFNKARDIHNTLGRLHKLRRPDLPIYFDKRNHQFMRDDGVHKNSVIQNENRKNERANSFGRVQPSVVITCVAIAAALVRPTLHL